MRRLILCVLISTGFVVTVAGQTATRTFRPDDLFQIRRIGATTWSADGNHVAIEFTKPGRWVALVPTADMNVLDIKTRTLRRVSSASTAYLGFFNPVWAPDGQRLAFLSVNATADVGLWLWNVGTAAATRVAGIDVRADLVDRPLAWADATRLAIIAWDGAASRSGSFYLPLLRGPNAANAWKRAVDGREAAVAVMSSGGARPETAHTRLVILDAATRSQRTLARGRINRLAVSPDGCCVSFSRTNAATVSSLFDLAARAADVDEVYVAASRGAAIETIDVRTGASVNPAPATAPRPTAKPVAPATPPRPNARRIAVSPSRDAELYVANDEEGSRLWITGGGGHQLSSVQEIWQANDWMQQVQFGRAQAIEYKAANGASLTAWVLLPPGYKTGTRVPVITVAYPGRVYGSSEPSGLSPFSADPDHPQFFARLGYAVLLPSVPTDPADPSAMESLTAGVLPAVDALIAAGIADPDRIAVAGHSGAGFATLGLITETTRFRSAIASAGYSNLVSLYGTFYGHYRYGDSGRPEVAQVLRMLQLERGFMGMAGPPWTQPDRYRRNSPLLRADRVETPLMLIHGDLDEIPVQQAEEFFTALLRRDKRAELVRYAGEGHNILDRANVLDMWARIEAWLTETMAPRR